MALTKNKFNLEVVGFEEEMRRIERELETETLVDVNSKIAFATTNLRIVTPVDTGKARAGWDSIPANTAFGEAIGLISNDVEYISSLNDGHSKQAPRYFIEQVLMKIGLLTP